MLCTVFHIIVVVNIIYLYHLLVTDVFLIFNICYIPLAQN